MTAYHTAMMAFWQRFGVPVFVSGCVPDGQAFPYLTADIVQPGPLATTVAAVISWHRIGEGTGNPMTERAALMDAIDAAIPPQGVRIDFEGGFAVLQRNDAEWHSYLVDEDDASIIGGRTSYEVTYYGM